MNSDIDNTFPACLSSASRKTASVYSRECFRKRCWRSAEQCLLNRVINLGEVPHFSNNMKEHNVHLLLRHSVYCIVVAWFVSECLNVGVNRLVSLDDLLFIGRFIYDEQKSNVIATRPKSLAISGGVYV